ncbi:MAG: M48 family metallopeptidase [Fibrobacter sp.]|nr:M48 family metallopeptidase [Fibrobacter sp.]
MNNEYRIAYGERLISYGVKFGNRRTMEIAVLPNCSVEVKAPVGSSLEAIATKVKKRAAWIVEKQDWFAKFPKKQSSRQYLGGETHSYMGRRYRLKIETVKDFVTKPVKISGGFIVVCAKLDNPQTVKKLLDEWLREKAIANFRKILEFYKNKYAVKSNLRMQVRSMKTRWGSLSKGGILTLNSKLIAASKDCIEYVIVHELCHLVHNDHGKAFYKLLERRMPDWEKRKMKLERER